MSAARVGRRRVKILFFAANASAGDRLALDEEYRAIEHAIRAARHRDSFQLIPKLAARPSDLQEALLEHCPDVVHFACHGSARAEVLLLDSNPGASAVSSSALTSLFAVLRDNLSLVVFNACFAADQAMAIREHAGLAIGMRDEIEDRAAITFAAALYGALAFGRPVRDAFDLGVAAIEAMAPGQKHLPQLFAGEEVDAQLTRLVEARRRWPRWTRYCAVACALFTLAITAIWPERSAVRPPPGMVRFEATVLHLGEFDLSGRPPQCRTMTASDDCAERNPLKIIAPTRVEAFELDKRETTNGEFAAWLNVTSHLWQRTADGLLVTRQAPQLPLLQTKACGHALTIGPDGRARVPAAAVHWPLICVTWHGAREYCRGQGKRLPLDAEWELAAKGSTRRAFPWGDAPPRQDSVCFERRSGMAAHPCSVGASLQDVSPEGVHDLGGNAAEWVDDGHDGSEEKLRGGGFGSLGPCLLLSSSCEHVPPDRMKKDIGFRCARSVTKPPSKQ